MPSIVLVVLLIACAAALVFACVRMRIAARDSAPVSILFGLCAAAAAAIILELSLFNVSYFVSGAFEPVSGFQLQPGGQIATLGDGLYRVDDDAAEAYFELTEIDAHIDNLRLDIVPVMPERIAAQAAVDDDLNLDDADLRAIQVRLQVRQAGRSAALAMPARIIVDTQPRTQYIRLYLSGESPSLRIDLQNCAGKTLRVNSVALNVRVPYAVSLWRMLAVFAILAFAILFRPGSPVHRPRLDLRAAWQKTAIVACVLVQIALGVGATTLIPAFGTAEERESSQYNQLAAAILDGHVYLNEQPPAELASLADPYDREARDALGVPYLWDHAYYQGKYYVYFGALPAIALYVPYQALTGRNLGAPPVHALLAALLAPGIALLLYALAKKYFPKLRFSTYLLVQMAFAFGCGLYDLSKSAKFYATAIFSALVLGVYGLYFLLSASRDGRLSKWRLALGTFLIACILGCRPALFIVILLAVPIFWKEIVTERAFFSKKGLGNTLCVLLPCLLVGACAMWYNKVRFGSVLDFGAVYNLTVANLRHNAVPIGAVPHGLFRFFLQPPVLSSEFPFLMNTVAQTGIQTFLEQEVICGGCLLTAPILLATLFTFTLHKYAKYRQPYILSALLLLFAFCIGVMDLLFAGVVMRYLYDFCWMLFLAAACVLFAYDDGIVQGALSRRWLNGTVALLTALTIAYALLLLLLYGYDSNLAQENATFFYGARSLAQFWY